MAIKVLGTVQRLVFGDGMPRTEHRTRDLTSLLSETEWGWSAQSREAYVFPQFEAAPLPSTAYLVSAESHAAALKASGEKHVYACVFGSDAQKQRAMQDEDRAAETLASVRDAGVVPEPEFETTGRPPIRPARTIPERIRDARRRRPARPVVAVSPSEAFAETARRMGEHE